MIRQLPIHRLPAANPVIVVAGVTVLRYLGQLWRVDRILYHPRWGDFYAMTGLADGRYELIAANNADGPYEVVA